MVGWNCRYVISFLKEHAKEVYIEVRAAYVDTMNKVNALEFHLPLSIDFLGLSYLISPFSFIVRWSAPLPFLIISNMRISTISFCSCKYDFDLLQ